MLRMNPLLLTDGYKLGHKHETPDGTTLTYSNLTPRSSRDGFSHAMWFGPQYMMKEYLIDGFNENFFSRQVGEVMDEFDWVVRSYLGHKEFDSSHIRDLHKVGYLPVRIKALPEGSRVPLKVPTMTIKNTREEDFWLTNYLETLMSSLLWMPSTSLATAHQYRRTFDKYAKETGEPGFVDFQGHDFSFRGMSSPESALLSGMAFLTCFKGTDCIPALPGLVRYYGASLDDSIGHSVPATEHALACLYTALRGEYAYFEDLITIKHPTGIVSLVADTYDFWGVLTEFLPRLKPQIMARDGGPESVDKVVIRPDSGNPVLIICGDPDSDIPHVRKGAIEVLWDLFGGTTNEKGFKDLDPHIGLIYGEAITPERQEEIFTRLKAKGFSSTNVVLGLGSMGFQLKTRDNLGWAIKGVFAENMNNPYNLFKDPATDNGGQKKSAKGLVRVNGTNGNYTLQDGCSWEEEEGGALREIFLDGEMTNFQDLETIRSVVRETL